MKKFLLLSVGIFYSVVASAQVDSGRIYTKEKMGKATFEEVFPFLNLKVYHDRDFVKEMVKRLYNEEMTPNTPESKPNITMGVFNEKDSNTLQKELFEKDIKFGLTRQPLEEQLKKVDVDPYSVFKELVVNSSIPKLSRENIKAINQVDKKALPRALEMVTEAGPDVGAKRVWVRYNNE